MKTIKTALVGYGFSAKTFHLPFLQTLEQFKVTAVSTSKPQGLDEAAPDAKAYQAAEAMIDRCDAELVIITAPNDAHFPLAKRALERGKHVVVDKPFVVRSQEGMTLIELAKQQGILLSVFHNRRWDGDFLTLKHLIASGRLGDIRVFNTQFDRFRPVVRQRWRELPGSGTGIWFDLGPHLVDQALQLFGMPEAVSARCPALRAGGEVTDYFHVQLHYPQLEAVLRSSPFCAGPNLRFELQGSCGSYRKFGLDPQESRLIAGLNPIEDDWAQETADAYGTLHTEEGSETIVTNCGGYQHYYHQLAGAIMGCAPNPVPAEEALAVMRIIEAAEISSRTGQMFAPPA
ncbi:oxidoreductase [Motiliproteus coralliicola]|uniref:Oxidoreductase n=1 Tax=Motiliproteus coralliicola TaxID=2283196 RepID=A0A369WTE6_9GAMM|nr:oxidoreductase [Motiliproteus coralliicola]RDE24413.1 oxidoreductase [Motiliproteus coralliicola]